MLIIVKYLLWIDGNLPSLQLHQHIKKVQLFAGTCAPTRIIITKGYTLPTITKQDQSRTICNVKNQLKQIKQHQVNAFHLSLKYMPWVTYHILTLYFYSLQACNRNNCFKVFLSFTPNINWYWNKRLQVSNLSYTTAVFFF